MARYHVNYSDSFGVDTINAEGIECVTVKIFGLEAFSGFIYHNSPAPGSFKLIREVFKKWIYTFKGFVGCIKTLTYPSSSSPAQ